MNWSKYKKCSVVFVKYFKNLYKYTYNVHTFQYNSCAKTKQKLSDKYGLIKKKL